MNRVFSIADILLYSTLRVETFRAGVPLQKGTGFVVEVKFGGDRAAHLLVTNKHVLEGADHFRIEFHLSKSQAEYVPSGASQSLMVQVGPDAILRHPEPDVDLCCLVITELLAKAEATGRPYFVTFLALNMIPSGNGWDQFDGIEEVLMIGCPNGLYDKMNNLALTRRGITATPLYNNYEGRREFAVDMACYPGSSGSPIFVFNPHGYFDKKQNTMMMGRARINLVGILYAGPLVQNSGHVVLGRPPTVEVATMMHLGYAVKSDRILDLVRLLEGIIGQQAVIDLPAS